MRHHYLIGLAAMAVITFASLAPGGAELIPSSHATEADYAPQISQANGIKVTATLHPITSEATWEIAVVMETHTQALEDDMSLAAVLIADGAQLKPLRWTGAAPGGHHRKGVLLFKALVPRPQAMELQIRLAGDNMPRSFKWLLQQAR